MSISYDFSTSDTLFGVGRSDASAVGKPDGFVEALCWRTASLLDLPFASIETISA